MLHFIEMFVLKNVDTPENLHLMRIQIRPNKRRCRVKRLKKMRRVDISLLREKKLRVPIESL